MRHAAAAPKPFGRYYAAHGTQLGNPAITVPIDGSHISHTSECAYYIRMRVQCARVSTVLHVGAIGVVVMGLLWACRFVYRRSRIAGLMFAAGVCVRAAGAAFFLSVSYFRLPFLTGLQMGDGFWTLASDAQEYYRLAALVAERWQATITPGYVGPLGLWMRVVGVNPASPVLFGLVMYALAVVMLVAAFGQNRTRAAQQALHLGVAALSFSPMLIYAGVFGLKDVFFTTLVVVMAVAYLTLLAGAAWTRATLGAHLLVAAAGGLAVWLIEGTRSYFAILMWLAMAVTYAGCVIAGVPSRRRSVVQAAVVLPVVALVIIFGLEPNYPRFARKVAASIPGAVLERRAPIAHGGLDELDRRREAIDDYGGNSMLSRRPDPAGAAAPPTETAGVAAPLTETTGAAVPLTETAGASRLEGLAVGLGAVFVPSSLLGRLAGVQLQIGTSARLIADADTLAFDLIAALILWVLIVNRREISPTPLLFGLALAVLVALPLAYVMTNYGTLIRLRLLVAAPVWLLTLALAPGFARLSLSAPAPNQSHGGTSEPFDGR